MLEDNKQLIYDNEQLEEFKSLVSEMGLKCNNRIDSEKSPIPYMWLDASTVRAFKLLCPSVARADAYRLEIPLEILRNIKLAKTEKYFDWVEIWHNDKDPDPFCIGCVYKSELDRTNGYAWNVSHYLIGRWGAENKTVPELINIALEIATNKIKTFSIMMIAKMESLNKCPDIWAKKYLADGDNEVNDAILR